MNLDDDVAAAVERLRREQGYGLSEALNELAREGLAHRPSTEPAFEQRTASLGQPRIPIDDVAGALDVLEGDARR